MKSFFKFLLLSLFLISFTFATEITTVGRVIGDDVSTIMNRLDDSNIQLKHSTVLDDYDINTNKVLNEKFNSNHRQYSIFSQNFNPSNSENYFETQEFYVYNYDKKNSFSNDDNKNLKIPEFTNQYTLR